MATLTVSDLTARQKAAIVVMTIGPEAGPLLKQLGGQVIEQLAEEIVQLGEIPPTVRDRVLMEFHNRLAASQRGVEGGLDRASQILEAGVGKERAGRVVQRIGWRASRNLTNFARRDPARFARLLEAEHPQTIAFLMTQLDPDVAGRVMAVFPEDAQPDLTWRIATMGEISGETAAAVHRALAPVIDPRQGVSRRVEKLGGERKAAGLLNMVPLSAQKTVLESLASRDADVTARVRKLMFEFRDILLLDDRSMQRVLKEVDVKDLSIALKGADDDLKQKVFRNVSERAAASIREEIEYMGRVKPKEVGEAQDRIIDIIRSLEEKGEVVIERGGDSGSVS